MIHPTLIDEPIADKLVKSISTWPKNIIGLDVETDLITEYNKSPDLVCYSISGWYDEQIVATIGHVLDGSDVIAGILSDPNITIVNHFVAYDMCVIANTWPHLIPLIFEAYEQNRIIDVLIREQLQHIALGIYRGFISKNGKNIKLNYSLADCINRRLGITLPKDDDIRLKYGNLINVPISNWDIKFIKYSLLDAIAPVALYVDQESDEGKEYLEDQYRQSRASLWMQLMSCWGVCTDADAVNKFQNKVQTEYNEIAENLIREGLIRDKNTQKGHGVIVKSRKLKAVQELIYRAYTEKGLDVPRNNPTKKEIILAAEQEREPIGNIKTDADTCSQIHHPVLEQYKKLSSLMKQLTHDVPLLRRYRIHAKWDMKVTGRTSTSPNVQNMPRKGGQRECFVPRPGNIFVICDYNSYELYCVAQIMIKVLGYSRLAEMLNAGLDPHLEIARRILNISYEKALILKKNDNEELDAARQSSKIANYGFPGGLGIERFVEYARKQYDVIITVAESRRLKVFWKESFPEFLDYHQWIQSQIGYGGGTFKCLFSNRYMGNVSFSEASNGLYQALAVDGAKNAGFILAKHCYADVNSILFGSRPVLFPHDEFVVEVLDDEYAHDKAIQVHDDMINGASPFLPDVPPKAEVCLARRYSKKAKPVYKDGRLIPWDIDMN